ncbi:uncharacterized protein LOC116348078 [Contarinia nasturtii]|uniref:uncharacterized protein LOC116348078 n=1 Tax=Contarinia nasturtii TaxID=265458 RepID=UPI0012D45BDB|nr:uncharacterized protein LOC116348078 [Contarinia nasturtii]
MLQQEFTFYNAEIRKILSLVDNQDKIILHFADTDDELSKLDFKTAKGNPSDDNGSPQNRYQFKQICASFGFNIFIKIWCRRSYGWSYWKYIENNLWRKCCSRLSGRNTKTGANGRCKIRYDFPYISTISYQ